MERQGKRAIDYRKLTPKRQWKCIFSHSFKKNCVGFGDAKMLVQSCKPCLTALVISLFKAGAAEVIQCVCTRCISDSIFCMYEVCPALFKRLSAFIGWLDTSNQKKKKNHLEKYRQSPYGNKVVWYIAFIHTHNFYLRYGCSIYILPLKVHAHGSLSNRVWKSCIKSTTSFRSSVQCFPISLCKKCSCLILEAIPIRSTS